MTLIYFPYIYGKWMNGIKITFFLKLKIRKKSRSFNYHYFNFIDFILFYFILFYFFIKL